MKICGMMVCRARFGADLELQRLPHDCAIAAFAIPLHVAHDNFGRIAEDLTLTAMRGGGV
jgi:hypothetical protein